MPGPLLNRPQLFRAIKEYGNAIGVRMVHRTTILVAVAASVMLCACVAKVESARGANCDVKQAPRIPDAGTCDVDCRTLLEELCDAAEVAGHAGTVSGTTRHLAWNYAATPRGAACLREMLHNARPARAAFASNHMSYSGDFANIEPLLACAERHVEHDRVVDSAISTIDELLATGSHRPHMPGEAANLDAIRRMRGWIKDARGRGMLPESYEELWGARLKSGIKELLKKEDWELQEGMGEAMYMLAYSRDSRRAASFLFGCMAELEEGHYNTWVAPALLRNLQFHVGPLDRPRSADAAQNRRAVQKALEWWAQNKEKRPVDWMLRRLALHGHATSRPDDAKTTADALLRALAKGRPAERYAATRVLGYVLPDGDAIAAFREDVFCDGEAASSPAAKQEPEHIVNAREYCLNRAICRATRWAAWECVLYYWDPESSRYVRKLTGK